LAVPVKQLPVPCGRTQSLPRRCRDNVVVISAGIYAIINAAARGALAGAI